MHFRARVDHEDLVERKTYKSTCKCAHYFAHNYVWFRQTDRQTDKQRHRDIEIE